MKNRTLAETNRSIPYVPALRPYAGSVTACLLMQQLDFWFASKNGDPFFKFLDAQKNEKPHQAYKVGDSWCEELSVSRDEFRGAFDKIGCRYKSVSEYRKAENNGDPFQGHYYLSFTDKIKGLTWYMRNHKLLDALLISLFNCNTKKSIYVNKELRSSYKGKGNSTKLGKSIPNRSKTTPQNTAETTITPPVSSAVVSPAIHENETLNNLLEKIPTVEHCPRLLNAISAALTANGENYTKSNIEYCLAKHMSKGGTNSIGGMIVTALTDDYAKTIRNKTANDISAKARIAKERQILDEKEKRSIEIKTEEDRQWSESEEGKAFLKQLLLDDPL